MLEVFLPGSAVDQYVIEKYEDKFPQDLLKDLVHQTLESAGSVGETKWHHEVLIVTRVCLEVGLMNVIRLHTELVEA